MRARFLNIISITSLSVVLFACTGGYSFTGADIAPNIKTVTIEYFPNRASLVHPELSNLFTEALKDKFISQTNLELTTYGGDLVFEGEITNYSISPQAFKADETSALTRLTITVRVKYTNTFEPKKSFDTSFSRYADFESSQSLSAVESELMTQICEELIVDIFNKSIANW